jgi:hypothetical protein
MAKKQPAEESLTPKRPPRPKKARSNATPGLWRGLLEWLRDGRLLAFLLALGSAVTLGYLFFYPAFAVAEVAIEGNLVLPADQARQESRALGVNIFLLNTLSLSEQLTEIPYVQQVEVERYLPNRVLLRIQERFPSVSWWAVDAPQRFLVDNSGLVLGPEQEGMSDLIYIMDLGKKPVGPGDHVDIEAVRTAQQGFSRLFMDLHIPLLAFEYQEGRGITAVSAAGWKACLGSSDHLEEKVRNLVSLLQSGVQFDWVDLRMLDRMIYH